MEDSFMSRIGSCLVFAALVACTHAQLPAAGDDVITPDGGDGGDGGDVQGESELCATTVTDL